MKVKLAELIEKQYGFETLPDDPAYAMAYVPFQSGKTKLFSPEQGLVSGTMFKELNKPFCGGKCGDGDD